MLTQQEEGPPAGGVGQDRLGDGRVGVGRSGDSREASRVTPYEASQAASAGGARASPASCCRDDDGQS